MTYLEEMWSALSRIERSAYRLDELGAAFEATGNTAAADRLYSIAGNVLADARAARSTMDQHTADEFRQVQQSSANILKACLAGVSLAKGGAA